MQIKLFEFIPSNATLKIHAISVITLLNIPIIDYNLPQTLITICWGFPNSSAIQTFFTMYGIENWVLMSL